MSYVSPAGDAVNLQVPYGAYVRPVGGAVNFSFATGGTPVASISGKSTVGFVAIGLVSSGFTSASTSAFQPENPYRDFSIASVSSTSFFTWLRTFSASGSTQVTPRAGFRALVSGATTVGASAIGLLRAAASVPATSLGQFSCYWEHRSAFSADGIGKLRGAGGYTKPLALRVVSRSLAKFKGATISGSAFSSAAPAGASFFGAGVVPGSAAVEASSAFSGAAVAIYRATCVIDGLSSFYPVVQEAAPATYSIYSEAQVSVMVATSTMPVERTDWSYGFQATALSVNHVETVFTEH